MKKLLSIIILSTAALILSSSGCSKNKKGCWQAWDIMLAEMHGVVICDKTLSDAQAEYPSYMFCPQGESKLCWKRNGTEDYYSLIPKTIIEEYSRKSGMSFTQVDCSSYCVVNWAEKKQSKATGQYTYIQGLREVLKNSDSCSRLFVGRIVKLSETADSILIREVTSKRP